MEMNEKKTFVDRTFLLLTKNPNDPDFLSDLGFW